MATLTYSTATATGRTCALIASLVAQSAPSKLTVSAASVRVSLACTTSSEHFCADRRRALLPQSTSLKLEDGTTIADTPGSSFASLVSALCKLAARPELVCSGSSSSTSSSSSEDERECGKWLASIADHGASLEHLDEQAQAQASDEAIKSIEQQLATRTFALAQQQTVTAADLSLFCAVAPALTRASLNGPLPTALTSSFPNIARVYDTVLHSPRRTGISDAIKRASENGVFERAPLAIDTDQVAKREYKTDAKPAAAAAAAAGATAAKKDDKKNKQPSAEKGEAAVEKKGTKKEKKPKAPAAPAAAVAGATTEAPAPWMIDLRVGRIKSIQKHPDADSLYVEQIDIGEPEPRTVVSGLVKYVPIDEMQDRLLVTVCNLKPASMRGIKSFAMVLCASDAAHTKVELMAPPPGSEPGDRVYFEGFDDAARFTPLELLNPKKKIFEAVQPGFVTLGEDEQRTGAWRTPDGAQTHKIKTDKGYVTAPSLVGASLS